MCAIKVYSHLCDQHQVLGSRYGVKFKVKHLNPKANTL